MQEFCLIEDSQQTSKRIAPYLLEEMKLAKRCGILITEESVAFTFGGLAQSIQLEESKGCQNLVKEWQQFLLSIGSLVLT
jgi:hypothetical protein